MSVEPRKSMSFGRRDVKALGSINGRDLDDLQSEKAGSYQAIPVLPETNFPGAPEAEEPTTEVTPFAANYASNQAAEYNQAQLPTRQGSRVRETAAKYTLDWLLWILLILATAALELVPPRAVYIPYQDLPRYSFPFQHHDTVPTWTVPVYSIVGPYAVMAPLTMLRHRSWERDARPYRSLGGELSRLATTLLTAEFATGLTTNAVKLMVGRPRPNFAERCWPDGKIQFKTPHPLTLDPILNGGVPRCTGKPEEVKEGMKSFPSGHTSWSAAGLSFFSWWLRDYLKPVKVGRRGHAWHAVACYWPMFGAVLVGVSRYTDYMHHWQDILVGYLLGTGISWVMYHLRYPAGWNQVLPTAE